MSQGTWSRQPTQEEAAERILDTAGELFAESGVAATTMTDIWQRAGCSRATLYRYFPSRGDLHRAFVDRAVTRIASGLAHRRGGKERGSTSLADRIIESVQAVRDDPALATWFEPENVSVPMAIGNTSSVLRAMMQVRVSEAGGGPDTTERERAAKWLLRCITSLLANPYETAEEERAVVEKFIVPSFLAVVAQAPEPARAEAG